jgi:hypothetical protein
MRELENILLKRLPPDDPKVRDIIARRQLTLSKKLMEDERRHLQSQKPKLKITVKRNFPKQNKK